MEIRRSHKMSRVLALFVGSLCFTMFIDGTANSQTVFEFEGLCTSHCDSYGLTTGDPVYGSLTLEDAAVAPNSNFGRSDVLAFNMQVGWFSFDYPNTTTELIPISGDGGSIDSTGNNVNRILLRGGPSPDVVFRFPDIINTNDTWRAATCAEGSDCIETNVLAVALGTGVWGMAAPIPFPVAIDIKPQGCPNPLNTRSEGVIAVAVLGSEDFSVANIDPDTILLESVAPIRHSFDDVSAPPSEPFVQVEDRFDCVIQGPDGFVDLVAHFKSEDLVSSLSGLSRGDVLVLELTGELLDGTPFQGEDVMIVVH